MSSSIKKYLWVLPFLFILVIAYTRYTYIINPNFQGEPVFLEYGYYAQELGAHSMVNIRSIIIYWILFFSGNVIFFHLLFSSKEKVRTVIFFFLVISIGSAGCIIADKYMVSSEALFSMGAMMKNFILSPMFTAMSYIIIEYFQWFGKPN